MLGIWFHASCLLFSCPFNTASASSHSQISWIFKETSKETDLPGHTEGARKSFFKVLSSTDAPCIQPLHRALTAEVCRPPNHDLQSWIAQLVSLSFNSTDIWRTVQGYHVKICHLSSAAWKSSYSGLVELFQNLCILLYCMYSFWFCSNNSINLHILCSVS